VVYVIVHQHVWTGWTVYVSADHFVDSGQLGVMGFSPDYGRTTRLVGLLLERSFGIAAWHPAWLLLGPAVAAALRVGSGRVLLLVAVLAVGWLNVHVAPRRPSRSSASWASCRRCCWRGRPPRVA